MKSNFPGDGGAGKSGRRFLANAVCVIVLLLLITSAIYSYLQDGIVNTLLRRDLSANDQITLVRDYFQSWGAMAPVAYVVFVTVEVVIAPIPGLMLYAPGGLVFGGFWGGLLSTIGNVLGAGISCQFVRVVGGSRLGWMWESERLQVAGERLSKAGVWLIFALRINPITSSDLVSYAAGLTSIPVWKVMLGTFLGMAPLCWAQAYLADELLSAFPALIYPLLIVCAIYVVLTVVVLWRLIAGCKSST